MSIIISNVSDDHVSNTGKNSYELKINRKLICTFEHDRQANGLAQCLRDAADAVEAKDKMIKDHLIEIASNGFRLDDLLG